MPTYRSSFVRKLTAIRKGRQQFDAASRLFAFIFVLAGSIASTVAAALPPTWHPTDEITASAEAYLLGRIGSKSDKTTVKAGNLDSRHRLAYCSEPLESFLRRGAKIGARTIVGVRCSGAKPWKVYLPIDVIVTDIVLVANRTLPRGHLIAADDVSPERRDVSRLLSGYLSEMPQLLGQRLKSQQISGTVLTPAMLQLDTVVRRDQTVTMTIGSSSFNIKVSGIALTDGALNQRIRIKNNASGRIVEGIVRSGEHVEVLIPSTNQSFSAEPKVSPKLADTVLSNNDR